MNKSNKVLTRISNTVDKTMEIAEKTQKIVLPGQSRRKMFLCIIGVGALTYLAAQMIKTGGLEVSIIWTVICIVAIIGFFFGANVLGDHLGEFLFKKKKK